MIRNTCLWLCSLLSIAAGAETAFENERARWLETAERSKPQLHYRTVKPVAVVTAVKDSSAYQGWRYEKTGEPAEFYADNFNRRTTVTLDFGEHLVGYCSFHIKELTLVFLGIMMRLMLEETTFLSLLSVARLYASITH